MANPQPDKFVKISTELFEALCRTHLNGNARQILDVIFRKTYGFGKKEDAISLNQFSKMTNINSKIVPRYIKSLLKMNIISVDKSNYITQYSIQKDYEKWEITTIKTDGSLQGKLPSKQSTIKIDGSTIKTDGETTIKTDGNNRYIDSLKREGEPPDTIQILWIKTFGRNPKFLEREETENFIKKFGEKKTESIFKNAVKMNFHSVFTLAKQIDENGNIKPREKNYASTKTSTRKYGYEYSEDRAKQRLEELKQMDS